jgi:hypothetical protein
VDVVAELGTAPPLTRTAPFAVGAMGTVPI